MEAVRINDDTYRIEDGGVRCFLLCGDERAMVIDTGMSSGNVREIAEKLTSLPVFLINTHADIDHVSGNKYFDRVYMHPAELYNYRGDIIPVWDGQIIDLGSRLVKVIHTPGHTPGSIALLDTKYRALFSGDPVQDGSIFLFGSQREMHAYRHSLIRISEMRDDFDTIYPSHGTVPVEPEIIDGLIEGTDRILRGEIAPERIDMFGNKVNMYDIGVAKILGD